MCVKGIKTETNNNVHNMRFIYISPQLDCKIMLNKIKHDMISLHSNIRDMELNHIRYVFKNIMEIL